MKQRLVAGVLIVLLCGLLTGCGGSSEETTAQVIQVEVKPQPMEPEKPKSDTGTSSVPEEKDDDTDTVTDSNGEPLSYETVLVGECTAYSGHKITATGTTPHVGVVAVDPSVIPYGTELYLVSVDGDTIYGYATAEDTGDALENGEVLCDLYMDSQEECDAFGRQMMYVYILE